MVYVFLADGFEEIEAVTPIDILRRAQIEVTTVGVTGSTVTGAHGIQINTDIPIEYCNMQHAQMLVLPGGMPGTSNLEASKDVTQAICLAAQTGKYVAAICAAPSILGHLGILQGKHATCFPSFKNELSGALLTKAPVEVDGNIITSRGAGTAAEFAFSLARLLAGEQTVKKLMRSMQFQR